jgi:hypothetical protein
MSRQKISLNTLSGPDSRDLSVRYPADRIRVSAWYCQNLSEVPACYLGITRGRARPFYLPVLPLYGFTKLYTNPFLLIYYLPNFKLLVLVLVWGLERKKTKFGFPHKHSLYKHPTNKTSSLYDDTRTPCALTPKGFVEFQTPFSCPGPQNATEIRAANAHLMFINMVGMSVTPLIFHGLPYRLGDQGGGGLGALEFMPHGTVHFWVNLKKLAFRDSASDPIFFGHHANMDRL